MQSVTWKIPELSLVLLIGPSGAGKTTFVRTHFDPQEVLSEDDDRSSISDEGQDRVMASEILSVASARLEAGKCTVIDAQHVQASSRKPFVQLARRHHCIPVAIVFDLDESICVARNKARSDRAASRPMIREQSQQLKRALKTLDAEGFLAVFTVRSPEEVAHVSVKRQPLQSDRTEEPGPFDIIGDVHGCFDELYALLNALGYQIAQEPGSRRYVVTHPGGRKAVYLGDLVDRGPKIPEVLRLTMDMVESGVALCVPGNHDMKLLRKLKGHDVKIAHGLAESLAQLDHEPPPFHERVVNFLGSLPSHYVLAHGNLVVAHAGLKREMQGRDSRQVREFAYYGETTGESDSYGLPVRLNWAADYRGDAMVVYGHTPVQEPEWLNRTINIDTGCVYGGALTALRYPEKEWVSVPAAETYYESVKLGAFGSRSV